MYQGRRVPVALEYSEGGVPTEPYIKSTDEFVTETDVTYIVNSDPVRIQGHPYGPLSTEGIKMVNPSKFNVVKLNLPDLNKLMLAPLPGKMDLNTEQYVWKLVGFRVDVQGPQCPAVTGISQSAWQGTANGLEDGTQPTETVMPSVLSSEMDIDPTCMVQELNSDKEKFKEMWEKMQEQPYDPEDPTESLPPSPGPAAAAAGKNYRWGMEHAQRQMIIVGCKPPMGYYEMWNDQKKGYERKTEAIDDDDLCEFGYGTQNTDNEADLTWFPVEMDSNHQCFSIDEIGMANDMAGDRCFMMVKREASGIRQTLLNGNVDKDFVAATGNTPFKNIKKCPQPMSTKTAGLVSSASDIFNKGYWLNKARGVNNGILWGNSLYITFVDNTRGQILGHTTPIGTPPTPYDPTKYNFALRHIKEFQVQVIVRRCKVKLEAKLLTQLLQLNKDWLKNLGFSFNNRFVPTQGVFTDLSAEREVEADPEEEKDLGSYIEIDCVGKVTKTEHSHHAFARAYHALNGAAEPAPKRKRTTKS